MALVIFDIDGTLMREPASERRFFRELRRRRLIGPRQALAWLAFVLRFGPRYGRQVLKKNKAYLSGLSEDVVRRAAAEWAPQVLREAGFEPALQRLQAHRQAGDTVVLLSGTPQFVAEALAAALGVNHVVATRCAQAGGRFGAAPPQSHPFGAEKRALLEDLAARWGVARSDIVAYADSSHDLPLLEWVGRPVTVRPDRALARVAAARGWDVIGGRAAPRILQPAR